MPDIQTHWSILSEVESMDPPIWLWLQEEAVEDGLSLSPAELRELLVPPLGQERDDSAGLSSPEEVAKRHWNQFVEVLYEEDGQIPKGYETLVTLRDQIDARVGSITSRQEKAEDQLAHIELLFEKHVERLRTKLDGPIDWPLTLRVGEMSAKTVAGWQESDVSVREVFGDLATQQALRLTLSTDEMEEAGISPENLRSADFDLFDDATSRSEEEGQSTTSDVDDSVDSEYVSIPVTWEDALEELIATHADRKRELGSLLRAHELLTFRRAVLENVLYRFEMIGRVDQLSATELKPFTDEIPVEWVKVVVEAGEDLGAKKGRKNILKEAAKRIGIRSSRPYRTLRKKLSGLYPKQGGGGRPKERKKIILARQLIRQCQEYISYVQNKEEE
ncbi:hypothetical protein GGP57_003177 [Salinibacter ruber]|uniref:hypothetical protein n=1 Tax=Salinibacter ruber TaxID=146919 RepID=UPI002166F247|nr:hypothetical protein [Salinibacter ruber]MCS3635836.1 hypothetical protein [Salinibacter ruber]MCS3715357.1 hypothetical protein [Salinibacter ruber]